MASDAVRELHGGSGDDILMDGAGRETLHGGTGADIFVFGSDDEKDFIRDFDPAVDRIDLSGAGRVRSMDDLDVRYTDTGLKLVWGQEVLFIEGSQGNSMTTSTLERAILFETDRVPYSERAPIMGTPGSDTFLWVKGADIIDGGGGVDTIDYRVSPQSVIVDLQDQTRNALAAEGDVLVSIERLVGTMKHDTLIGDSAANILTGLDGNDHLAGAAGNDWLQPGQGQDLVDGGDGKDMISLSDLPFAARISLASGQITAGGVVSTVERVEDVTGTIHGDLIEGDSGTNRLRGLGDYDWFIATEGGDQYDGGKGRYMVSYVNASGSVTVDLAIGKGTAGLAAGDSYVSIERITGSVHADKLYGFDGDEDLRGLGGYDWFIGSPGRDRFDGGSGKDTVAYWASDVGVTASLNLGRGSTGDAKRDLYTSIENLTGSSYADNLTGSHGRNVLRGLGGNDTLLGYGGVDRLQGGRGDDFLDGGWSWDVALFSGPRNEYTVTKQADGSLTVEDNTNWRDGTDKLLNIEALLFEDGMYYF